MLYKAGKLDGFGRVPLIDVVVIVGMGRNCFLGQRMLLEDLFNMLGQLMERMETNRRI